MKNETGPAATIRGLARWVITPPQSYAVYLIGLILIFAFSFYAGSLKQKKIPNISPPPASIPAAPRT